MAPVKARSYEFNARSIAEVRARLKMKQAKMAELLGVPANTLSRWETGATTPDANSLAAIYSIAQDNGLSVNFFEERAMTTQQAQNKRLRVGVFADFQNVGIPAKTFSQFNKQARQQIEARFPDAKRKRFRGFLGQKQFGTTLRSNQWGVVQIQGNVDAELIKQAKAYCKTKPNDTALVLITKDGDFSNLAKELRATGVQVWLLSPPDTSKKLREAIGKQQVIPWPDKLR